MTANSKDKLVLIKCANHHNSELVLLEKYFRACVSHKASDDKLKWSTFALQIESNSRTGTGVRPLRRHSPET